MSLERLLAISSDAIASKQARPAARIPDDLALLLEERNGFYAFESALEVFPLGPSHKSFGLAEWNAPDTWINAYCDLAPDGICFAQDIFGGQFVRSDRGVDIFEPETAGLSFFASGLDEWAAKLLADYRVLTGQPIAHEWQAANGRVPF